MQVTNVTVGYDRKRQPAQYESAGAKVEFACVLSATVGDTEDHVAVATKLLGEAKTIVLTELGIVKAGTSASATVLAAASEVKPADTAKAPTPSTAKPTAAEKKAAKAAAAAGTKPSEEPQIRTNPENRVDPAQQNDDIPGEGSSAPAAGAKVPDDLPEESAPATTQATTAAAPAGAVQITHQELHAFIAQQIKDKKLDHPTVKSVSAEFKVARIADLKPEQIAAYKAKLDEKIKELGANPDISDL